jgi:hypothetical protein
MLDATSSKFHGQLLLSFRIAILSKTSHRPRVMVSYGIARSRVSNVDFHNNVIQDIQGAGLWVCLTGCQASNFSIYNNVIWRPSGSNRPGPSNGILSCINPRSRCTNWSFIGNDVINYTADYSGALGTHCDGNPSTFTWQNNLFYGITPAERIDFQTCGGSLAEGNNSYLNSGTPKSGTNSSDIVGRPEPPVPLRTGPIRFSHWPAKMQIGRAAKPSTLPTILISWEVLVRGRRRLEPRG